MYLCKEDLPETSVEARKQMFLTAFVISQPLKKNSLFCSLTPQAGSKFSMSGSAVTGHVPVKKGKYSRIWFIFNFFFGVNGV